MILGMGVCEQCRYLAVDVGLSVVHDFVVGTAAHLFLWPLAVHPLLHPFAGDAVALYDALDAYLVGGSHHHHAIYQTADARLLEYDTLHPLHAAGFEVAEHGGVYDGVNRLGVRLAG